MVEPAPEATKSSRVDPVLIWGCPVVVPDDGSFSLWEIPSGEYPVDVRGRSCSRLSVEWAEGSAKRKQKKVRAKGQEPDVTDVTRPLPLAC